MCVYICTYAQTLIVVALIVVNFFTFLKITRLHWVGIGRNLVQMILTGLPELFKHNMSCKNSRGDETTTFEKLFKIRKQLTTINM